MAEIKAFKGLRYTEKAGKINELCCPPYDIINEQQREQYLRTNNNNIIRLELPKAAGDSDSAYDAAGKLVNDWLIMGILQQDEQPGIYIYEMDFTANGENYAVKGIVSLVKLEEFSKGIVLPHEETLSKAKTDRFNLMTATGCNFSQIYSLYMDENRSVYSIIDGESQRNPDISFTDEEGVTHKLWCMYDAEKIALLCEKFNDKKLYIADGHHRYETALNYRNSIAEKGVEKGTSEYVPMMLVNMENDGLVVFPTHRIVRDLPNFNREKMLEACAEFFDITEADPDGYAEIMDKSYRNDKKSFVFYADGKYNILTLKDNSIMQMLLPGCSEALKMLDVSVLHTLVLERIFGIDKANMAAQINLTYTKLADDAIKAVNENCANCAFLLNPTKVAEIRDVAAAGEKMPQKSTYFYPKLITGLVMNKIF